MANEENKAAAGGNGNPAKPTLNVLAQYVKDLSFESPGAPKSLRGRDKAPSIAINLMSPPPMPPRLMTATRRTIPPPTSTPRPASITLGPRPDTAASPSA